MYTKLSASRAYTYTVGKACDAGHISRRVRIHPFDLPLRLDLFSNQDCAGAILFASDRAVEVANDAMQSLGGNGYINGRSLFIWLHFLFGC